LGVAQMNGKDRVLCALARKPHDGRAVVPIVGQAGAALCGVSIFTHAHDPAVLASCQVRCARRFGYDGVYISADTWVNAEAVGYPHVEHPPDGPAGGKGGWIETARDIEALSPPDPERSGRWPLMVRAVQEAVKLAGQDLAVIANFDQSPFSLASQLRGLERFLIDLEESPSFAHRLLEFCAEAVTRYAIALGRAGADVLNTGDSVAGGSVIGPALYEQFAFPYERRVISAVHEALGTPVTLHICGDATVCLERMVETGADGIELDSAVDASRARRTCEGRVAVIGNIDPVRVLLEGTADEVYARSREILEVFRGCDGFILSSGCALSPKTPPANISAMVRAAREQAAAPGRSP